MSHTSTENRIPTETFLLPGQQFCIGVPWERAALPAHGVPVAKPKAAGGNALDARVLAADPCAGWEIGPCQVIRRLSPGSARILLAVRDEAGEPSSLVVMRRIELPDMLGPEVQTHARWATQYRHANLARVFDAEVSEEGLFWVTELAPGATLAEVSQACRLAGRGVPVGFALSAVCDAARGLAQLHQAGGFAHALVSDQSITVDFDGSARLGDVGLFRCLARKASWAEVLEPMGPYLAPEQVLRGHLPDAKCDVYSLAVVLYELLAGEKVRRAASFEDRVKLLQRSRFLPPSSLNVSLGRGLDEVMARAVCDDRARRYADAGEFSRALQQVAAPFLWQASQRARYASELFPERMRREQVLVAASASGPAARPQARRIPTAPALKLPASHAVPPPLPRRAYPVPPRPRLQPPGPSPFAEIREAPPEGHPTPAQARPARAAKAARAAPPKQPARGLWRKALLALALAGSVAALVRDRAVTLKDVEHTAWGLAKRLPTPDRF